MIVTTTDKMTNWDLYDLPRKHYHICSQVFFSGWDNLASYIPLILVYNSFLTLIVTSKSSHRGSVFEWTIYTLEQTIFEARTRLSRELT
jgi:hypothetical protein